MKRAKTILGLLVFLFLPTFLMAESEIGICGWRSKTWKEFLEKECEVKSDILKEEDGYIPVKEFKNYKFIILSQDRPKPLTEEDNEVVKKYLKEGGHILITTITIGNWVPSDNRKFSSWADWIGATTYQYGKVSAKIISPENPIVNHFAKQEYSWFGSEPGLTDITAGRVIIGTESIGKVFINQYGKGTFIYFSPVVMSYYKQDWKDDPESSSLLLMVKKIVSSILKNEPPIEEIIKSSKGQKTEIISVAGKKKEVIIISDSSSISIARTLCNYLNKITSGNIKVILETEKAEDIKENFKIYVGRTNYVNEIGLDFDKLHPYGYYIISNPDSLVIAGKYLGGTSYAIYDFLKRFCGYRYFMPGELGEIISKKEIINLPLKIDIKEEPSFITYTNAGFYGGNGNFSRSWRTTFLASHNLYHIYSPEKYSESHPEYYPMIEGKRFIPPKNSGGTWQPCVSNPDLPEIAIEWSNEYFEKNPQMLGIPVGVNDGGGDCQCPDCLELKRKFKNQYIPFYNQIAKLAQKQFPDKLVSFIAYGGASPVPENIKLEPNIYVEVASGLRENMKLLEGWSNAGAKNIGIYDYLYGGGYIVPRHYPHIMGKAWKEAYKSVNLKGGWFETFTQVWLYDGPRQYVLNELAWDIDADIDKLLDDYFLNFYGEANKPMREFFDRIEEIYGRKKDPLHPIADWQSLKQLDEYIWDDLEYLNNKLNKAKELLKDEIVKKRIDLFEKIWRLSEFYLESYLTMKDMQNIEEIKKDEKIEDIINKAKMGFKAIESIENYQMTTEEEKNIFVNTNLESFKSQQTLIIKPYFENETYKIFTKITEYFEKKGNSQEDIQSFWKKVAEENKDNEIKSIALSQIFIKQSPESKQNLVLNGSFEPGEETKQEEVFSEEELEKFDWKKLDKRLKGWTTWNFQQSVTRFYWDPTQAHTGKYSISIRENQISGCFQAGIKVTPKAGYLLSFWVKQDPPDKGGSMTIRWMDKNGWADQGKGKAPRISISYPKERESKWQKVEFFFIAPEDITSCVLLFGAPVQKQDECIWFDDISLIKVYDPVFF